MGFYHALVAGHIDQAISFCTKDAVLTWASFQFIGRKEIRRWAAEFNQYFRNPRILDKNIHVTENAIRHEFFLYLEQAGRRGLMPCVGTYKVHEGRLKDINISFSDGYLLVNQEELSSRS